jgi:hypothetical protein
MGVCLLPGLDRGHASGNAVHPVIERDHIAAHRS